MLLIRFRQPADAVSTAGPALSSILDSPRPQNRMMRRGSGDQRQVDGFPQFLLPPCASGSTSGSCASIPAASARRLRHGRGHLHDKDSCTQGSRGIQHRTDDVPDALPARSRSDGSCHQTGGYTVHRNPLTGYHTCPPLRSCARSKEPRLLGRPEEEARGEVAVTTLPSHADDRCTHGPYPQCHRLKDSRMPGTASVGTADSARANSHEHPPLSAHWARVAAGSSLHPAPRPHSVNGTTKGGTA